MDGKKVWKVKSTKPLGKCREKKIKWCEMKGEMGAKTGRNGGRRVCEGGNSTKNTALQKNILG